MYTPIPKLSDWPWLEEWIAEVNTVPFPELDWTAEQHEKYRAMIEDRYYRRLIVDRQNLERLIEIVSIHSDSEVFHVVRDRLPVIVLPSGELELFDEGPSIRRMINEKVPLEKFRQCPGCKSIFWAKTKRSQTCGNKACADTLGNIKRAVKK